MSSAIHGEAGTQESQKHPITQQMTCHLRMRRFDPFETASCLFMARAGGKMYREDPLIMESIPGGTLIGCVDPTVCKVHEIRDAWREQLAEIEFTSLPLEGVIAAMQSLPAENGGIIVQMEGQFYVGVQGTTMLIWRKNQQFLQIQNKVITGPLSTLDGEVLVLAAAPFCASWIAEAMAVSVSPFWEEQASRAGHIAQQLAGRIAVERPTTNHFVLVLESILS